MRTTILVALFMSLVGCTTELVHEQLTVNAAQTDEGFPYYLPKQVYLISATFEIQSCPDLTSRDRAQQTAALTIAQSTSIIETSVADESQHFLLVYLKLNGPTKTTTFTATTYENKTLHTVGAQIEDRTGAIVKSLVSTAVAVAKIAVGIPTDGGPPAPLCSKNVYDQLASIQATKAKLADPNTDDKARSALQTALNNDRSSLQIQKQLLLAPDWNHLTATIELGSDGLAAWFKEGYEQQMSADNVEHQKFLDSTRILVKVAPRDSAKDVPAQKGDDATYGVVFRDPAPSIVMTCHAACDANGTILTAVETQISQLGRRMVVGLRNGAFDKNNLSASFAQNGRLESLTYGAESSLEKMAASAQDLVGQVEAFHDKERQAEKDKAQADANAKLGLLKQQTQVLNAESDLIEAKNRLEKLGGHP